MAVVTRAAVFTSVAALVVFAGVQDRVTVAGVGQYVALQREAMAGRRPAISIDDVMKPAVARGVQQGALWAGLVLVTGLSGTLVARRRRRGE
jgi:hypothetical protein